MVDSQEPTGQEQIGQDEIEQLLKQAEEARPAAPAAQQAPLADAPLAPSADATSRDVEMLLSHAQAALASAAAGTDPLPAGVSPYRFEDLTGATPSTEVATLDLIRDVELDLRIELGRTHMYLEDVLKLRKGSVVALDKLAGDPVDVYVNGRLIARGEVLVMNDNFCVRVAQLVESDRVDAA
ncbi:MAG: flagellar motor switch protein FliN [Pirellulales bacterium]